MKRTTSIFHKFVDYSTLQFSKYQLLTELPYPPIIDSYLQVEGEAGNARVVYTMQQLKESMAGGGEITVSWLLIGGDSRVTVELNY